MKNLLLIEHGGDAKSFIFDMIQDGEVTLFLAATYIPSWILTYVPKEKIILTDTYDAMTLISAVKEYSACHSISFDGVGTFYEHVVVQTSLLGEALNVVHLPPTAATHSSSNKLQMREAVRDAGLPTPRFTTIENPTHEELHATLLKFGFPAVIKPLFGSQSYGVKKIESDTTLKEDIEEILELTQTSKKEVFKNFNGVFLVEEYLSGAVVSVDGLVQDDNIQIAGMVEFMMGPEPHFTQEANYIPARVSDATEIACHTMVKNIIRAVGFNNCGFHCEMRLTNSGPVLIEIAARLPGGPLQQGYQKAYGYNLAQNLVDIWLGKPTMLTKKWLHYILQKAVFPRTLGTIKHIKGEDKVQQVVGLFDFVKISKEGESVVLYPSIPKPFYYYAVEGETREELEELSKKIEQTVIVSVE